MATTDDEALRRAVLTHIEYHGLLSAIRVIRRAVIQFDNELSEDEVRLDPMTLQDTGYIDQVMKALEILAP